MGFSPVLSLGSEIEIRDRLLVSRSGALFTKQIPKTQDKTYKTKTLQLQTIPNYKTKTYNKAKTQLQYEDPTTTKPRHLNKKYNYKTKTP
jgi:hypothetical protein